MNWNFILGCGLFAEKDFEPQEFIGLYSGDILEDYEGFKKLELERKESEIKPSYLYFVDNFW